MATTLRRTGGIQEVDVWNAADALLLAGERPTIEKVRQKLGRGSPNTVSPYLDAWFTSLGARIKDPGAFSAPNQVPDPIAHAAQHFWQSALATARVEADVRVKAHEAELEEATARANERARSLAAREDVLQEAARDASTRAQQATERAERLQGELTRREETNAQLAADLAGLRSSKESLERQLASERQGFDAERQGIESRHAANERSLALELDRAREGAKQAQTKLARIEIDAAERSEHSRAEISTLTQDVANARQIAERLRAEVADRDAAVEKIQEELYSERSSAAAREGRLATEIERVQEQLSAALEQLKAKDEQHGVLLKSLAKALGPPQATKPPLRPRGINPRHR